MSSFHSDLKREAEGAKVQRLSDDSSSSSSLDSDEESVQPVGAPREMTEAEKMAKLDAEIEAMPRYCIGCPSWEEEINNPENPTPPIMVDYRPRQHGRGGGGFNRGNNFGRGYHRGGGRGSFFQHSDRQYGNHRGGGNSHQGNRYGRRDRDREWDDDRSRDAKQRRLDDSQQSSHQNNSGSYSRGSSSQGRPPRD